MKKCKMSPDEVFLFHVLVHLCYWERVWFKIELTIIIFKGQGTRNLCLPLRSSLVSKCHVIQLKDPFLDAILSA
jgi:hypothetical protein